MSCECAIRFRITEPEPIKFNFSVTDYKERIVAPDEYSGATVVTPSDETQTLQTQDKLVRSDIVVNPAPTEPLSTTSNGEFFPSSGYIGFSDVTVDVQPELSSLYVTENGLYLPESGVDGFDRVSVDVPQPSGSINITANGTYDVTDKVSAVVNIPLGEWSAPTLIYEGDIETATSQFAVTELPNGQAFSFDRVVVEWTGIVQGQNVNKRTYWRSDMPMSGYNEPLIVDGGSNYRYNITFNARTEITIEDSTYIGLVATNYDINNPTSTAQAYQRKAHGGYDKITAYGWWSWNCPAGTHIKITGYNRTS